MSRWSHALTKAANFFGWDESNYRSDAELVDKIVQGVLNLPVLSATKFPVGLQSHVEDLIRIIKSKSMTVCKIGICGAGGSGKTTLAKAIYHQIQGTFRNKSFIEDVGQVGGIRGDIHVQEKLLLDILKTKVKIPSDDVGRTMIWERLYGKRVLIVVDDVPNYFEILALRNCSRWFSGGSVIMFTVRDESLLKHYLLDSVYRIELMNANKSLELLSWHAFREAKPKEEYNDLAKAVVAYCGGLPLALEVIGNSLFERTKEKWNTVLFELKKIPPHNVIEKLKISFNGLRNEMEKEFFLDVCCFFIGKGIAYATKILNGCGVDVDTGIRVLIERGLIKVKNNKFGMHPLLREMGREIICEISGKESGKNSELWFDKDVEYALPDNTLFSSKQTKVIQRLPVKMVLTTKDFFEPYLSDRQLKLAENPEYLSQKLRWITWQGFSSEYLPNDFYLHDAIAVDLKHSLLRLVWKEPQVLRSLKFLNLSHSMHLTETPDFSGLPTLEHLILKDCPRLCKVHQSIGCLRNLILLNLKDCECLNNLPREIYKLKSSRTFILSGCSIIDLMEKDTVRMKSLITVITENTVVKEVPFSMVSSKRIGYISLRGLEGLSHNIFPSIIRSWMSPTMNSISYVHSFCMDMEDNSWDDIVPLLSSLKNLRSILVQCDTEFQLSLQLETILAEYGVNIIESGISKQHFRSSLIGVGRYNEFFSTVSDSISEVLVSSESCDVSLAAVNNCLAHMGEGHSVSFTVPRDRNLKGMAFCVVYLSTPKIIEPEFTTVVIVNYTKCTCHIHNHGTIISFSDEDWRGIMSNLEYGDKVEIFVTFGHGLVLKNTVVYLICGKSHNLKKEPESKKNCLIRFIKKVVMCDFW